MLEEAQYKIPSQERLAAMTRQCAGRYGMDRGCPCRPGECKVSVMLDLYPTLNHAEAGGPRNL